MGKIETIGKWNLSQNKWDICPENLKGKSLSLVNYDLIKNNNTNIYNHIIICTGCRVENRSKDMENVKERYDGINQIMDYFSNTDKNIIVNNLLLDNDAPLKEVARWLGYYINQISEKENINSINVVGLSKGSALSFNMVKYLNKKIALPKTNLYTIATPFEGTLIASPKYLFKQLEDLIFSMTHSEFITKKSLLGLHIIFDAISSNSHMDYDIALPGGIADDKKSLYDETFIRDMFSKENISSVQKLNQYKNICTQIDEKTLGEAIRTLNFIGIGMCAVNKLCYSEPSDGFVTLKSQKAVENHIEGLKSIQIPSSHHAVTSQKRAFSDILHIVDAIMSEQEEKEKYKIRKLTR